MTFTKRAAPSADSRRSLVAGLLLAVAFVVGGCATTGQTGANLDPWENWNRKVFSFNESLDRNVLEPVARTYANVVPQLVRSGIGNFFANFSDAWSGVNNLLQGKGEEGFSDVIRVGTNTVFGILGVFDVASEAGIERHNEDFGQTLGHYGVGPGAYLVLPILGPSSVREAVALPLDRAVSPALLLDGGGSQLSIIGLQIVNARASFLGADRIIDDVALDKYTFIRDTYLARRRSLVYDGDPPETPDRRLYDEPSRSR